MAEFQSNDMKFARAGEATLDEMLDEPIVRMLMERDGVHQDELVDLLRRASQARPGRRRPEAA